MLVFDLYDDPHDVFKEIMAHERADCKRHNVILVVDNTVKEFVRQFRRAREAYFALPSDKRLDVNTEVIW